MLFHAKAPNTFAYRTAQLFILHTEPLMFLAKLIFRSIVQQLGQSCRYITGTRWLPASNNSIDFDRFIVTIYKRVFSVTSLTSIIINFGGGAPGKKITAHFLHCRTPIALALHAENLSHCSFNNPQNAIIILDKLMRTQE
jgi:hypothetical protein